jgi:AraC-like DNA-binding protein
MPVRESRPEPPEAPSAAATHKILSIFLVRALIEAAENAGLRREAFLEAAGFDPARVERREERITLEEYDALTEVARRLTNDPAMGLHMGQTLNATAHSLAAHLVAHAKTLRDAIDNLTRYHRILTGRTYIRLVETGESATLLAEIAPGSLASRRFRAEVAVTGLSRMIRYFARDARPQLVAFQHAAPDYAAEYRAIFDGDERFSQPFTGVVFDRAHMSAVQLNADEPFAAALRFQAEKELARLAQSTSYADRLREHILDPKTTNRRDMAFAARRLGMSARSLRRKLQLEGLSYTDVVDEALATLAKRLLADEQRTIEQTAYDLGFSAPSAFHKAFKRWTGVTPSDFRRRQGETL